MDKQYSISIIVPTLNEEKYLEHLLVSIEKQKPTNFEILVIDGGSVDKTVEIARKHAAKVFVLPGCSEFSSRNIGAKYAKGEFLLFTCSDIIFPGNFFKKILDEFQKDRTLIALTGPGYPYDAPLIGKIEYAAYNIIRFLFARLPRPLKRFSTSTNFLVVRKNFFEKTGGFVEDDINADGLMGKTLLGMGKVKFSLDIFFYLSARRMKAMGFINFNKHYTYLLENFFFNLSKTRLFEKIKLYSRGRHRKIHKV
jgi:glycosyltransferase involved in cell wall biosynthesis